MFVQLKRRTLHSRFPQLTIIAGHLGERIPSDLFRIDERMPAPVSSSGTYN